MRDRWVDLAALAIALGLASFGATRKPRALRSASPVLSESKAHAKPVQKVKDARGRWVRSARYKRIIALDPEASHFLLALVEPSRVLAVSNYTKNLHPRGFRFGELSTIEKSSEIDRIVALEPDLVIVNPLSDAASIARLLELGIAVFDLGGARDLANSVQQLGRLGQLLEEPERAALAQANLRQREMGLVARLEGEKPIPGIYLTRYGDKFYGGTQGSSFGDLLRLAGVDDLAARKGYQKWPSYQIEQLLELDPQVIVTAAGQGQKICTHTALSQLRACGKGGRVMELLAGFESDSAGGLLSAAGELLERLHPR